MCYKSLAVPWRITADNRVPKIKIDCMPIAMFLPRMICHPCMLELYMIKIWDRKDKKALQKE